MRHIFLSLSIAYIAAVASADTRPDLILANFEADNWADWKVEGEAFGNQPANGALPNQMPVSGYEGQRLVNSYVGGDNPHGKLTSPDFVISRKSINFLIGGGHHPDKTCVNLLIDSAIVRTQTGHDSESLTWESFDVAQWEGKKSHIEIIDDQSGGWGHILADQFERSDHAIAAEQTREIQLDKPFLLLPVKTGGTTRKMTIQIDGKLTHQFDIALAGNDGDFRSFIDMTRFKGKTATLAITPAGRSAAPLGNISTSDAADNPDALYHEANRPQFHFTSRRGWLNDPNGLVFYAGEYHLFYQHNPYSVVWGNMHWGHAISPDLVHWREQPDALYPAVDARGAVFSGSAIVDTDNSAGLQTGDDKTLVAFFTDTGAGESMAYSTDKGRTWKPYENNPVIKHAGRDPKVIWHAPTKSWVIAIYDEFAGKRYIAFYNSKNLRDWTFQSRIEGYFECPELFELPVDNDPANTRWILSDASFGYTVGQFDGKTFVPESPKLRLAAKGNFYAPQTWNSIPQQDGRRIIIGWMRDGKFPKMPFNQQMTFPTTLTLHNTPAGFCLHANPVQEIENLHAKTKTFTHAAISDSQNPLADITGELFHLKLELRPATAQQITLKIRGQTFIYDCAKKELDGIPLPDLDGIVRLEALVDRSSIEIFGNKGAVYLPISCVFSEKDRSLSLTSRGGNADANIELIELKTAWE
jgi:fructan beta-fructosidase